LDAPLLLLLRNNGGRHGNDAHHPDPGDDVAAALLAKPSIAADAPRPATTPATRRIVVSIPDHKLALIENGEIVRIYPVAVGAPVSPSPVGTFSIVTASRIPPTTSRAPSSLPALRIRLARAGSD
jgi:hypothetical protein